MLPSAYPPSFRTLSLILAVFLVGPTGFAQSDPFAPQFTFMNIWDNNNGTPGNYIQGIYNYGAADLVVEGNSAVGTAMTFKPNSLIYTGQTSTPKQLRYYEAGTLREVNVSPGMASASIVVNVTSVNLPANTEFYVVCKTLNNLFQETSAARFRITGTGLLTNTLSGLGNKVGNKLQIGFEMKGVTQTAANTGQVGLELVSRSISGTPANYPPTTTSQLLRNGDFNISAEPVGGVTLPDSFFWTPFEGAYVGAPSTVSTANSPTGGNVLIVTGQPYAGAWHDGDNGIEVKADGGKIFTLSFDAFFPDGYSSTTTSISFVNNASGAVLLDENLNSQIGPSSLEAWRRYTVRYTATDDEFAALLTGKMRLKVQTEGRVGTALFDNFVLSQQTVEEVGPQLNVTVAGASYSDGATAALFPPLIGYTTPYPIVLQNDGAQTLNISSVVLSGTSFAWSGGSSATLQPGESRAFTATATPASNSPLSGTLTVQSNDKEAADQSFVVNLATTPVATSDDFNSGDAASLGWVPVFNASGTTFDTDASVTVASGALRLAVDSSNTSYPWYYGAKKVFASPGTVDVPRSLLAASLRAFGKFPDAANNKVQVYLESLSSSGAATGRVSLGQWVDETTAGADPGIGNYFTPDGINDRVAILLPEGGGYTNVGSALSSAINQGFNPNAPAFQLVVLMTDFEFDLDAGNIVELDSLDLKLVTAPFEVANGGFESDNSDFGAGSAPSAWLQYPVEGVSKNRVVNGEAVYNASTGLGDDTVPFAAYAGTTSMKVYGQNFYDGGGSWVGPSQTGTVYQEWSVAGTVGLTAGQAIHARGAAKVFGIDPLSGGSTFKYGFRYMDAANVPVGSDEITTITSSNVVPDQWVALVANGTIPPGTAKVQLVAEFVQNNATDSGAVYLDDLSVGFGEVPATQAVGGTNYQLVWSDEFDGSSLNSGNWTPEIGTGENGWGNGEAQYYTDRPENLRVENGHLVIEAVKENYQGSSWTSARIKTQDKRSFKYGKIEFRAKLPSGAGPWPAAWLLGTNISTVGWPACGEIDVMEWRGTFGEANTVGHALHSPARHGGNPVEPDERTPVSNPSTEFHTYAVVWNSDSFTFSVDGVDVATLTPPVADAEVFRKEFFLLLNLAMGGVYNNYDIDPSLTKATYEVDYVRVYQAPQSDVPSDTTPPVITLAGANPLSIPWGGTYSDAGAAAFDAGDNASVGVLTSNPVDTSVPGTYLVTYTATDSKTNSSSVSRTVSVVMANGGTNVGADGLSDVSRYAFGGTGTNPLASSLMPVGSATNNGGTNQFVITYFVRTNANVDTIPMLSTNLGANQWSTNGITVNLLQTVNTNNMTLHKRQATTPMTGGQKFLRLRSTLTTSP